MSKVEVTPATQSPVLDPATLAAIKALVTELRAPTEKENKEVEAAQKARLDHAAIDKMKLANLAATQALCPHRQDQGRGNGSALVLIKGNIGLQDSFILCQCCAKKIFYTDPEWNSYVLRCN